MCLKPNPRVIDPCMKNAIWSLNFLHVRTLACCCGHGRYPMTIVVKTPLGIHEIFSGKEMTRKKRFYVRDKKGYFYIPETLEAKA